MSESQSSTIVKYLLVSDSNERSKQFESKKLSEEDLSILASEFLIKTHLTELIKHYITKQEFETDKRKLTKEINELTSIWNDIKNQSNQPKKFQVVDGQVILFKCSEIPENKTPEQHLNDNWDIPSNYVAKRISQCMLRGVTYISNPSISGFQKAQLTSQNIPSHQHHSSITNGMNLQGMEEQQSSSTKESNGLTYDMFTNDSISTGLSNNEMNGTYLNFEIGNYGQSESTFHDNMPVYDKFYAFEIRKVGN